MTLKSALAEIGGLSDPSKMPSYSWSIPAIHCKLGALLRKRPGSTCEKCYALKGCYVFASTRDAMQRRYDRLQSALEDPESANRFVDAFAFVLNKRRARIADDAPPQSSHDPRYFRWHDSGDLQSLGHLDLIVRIARATPDVAHWLPTREAGIVQDWLQDRDELLPDNLLIRMSVPMIDRAPSGLAVQLAENHVSIMHSAVHRDALQPEFATCPAYTQDGACNDCRACWSATDDVSYPLH